MIERGQGDVHLRREGIPERQKDPTEGRQIRQSHRHRSDCAHGRHDCNGNRYDLDRPPERQPRILVEDFASCSSSRKRWCFRLVTVIPACLYLPRRVIGFNDFMNSVPEGGKLMMPAIPILVLARLERYDGRPARYLCTFGHQSEFQPDELLCRWSSSALHSFIVYSSTS